MPRIDPAAGRSALADVRATLAASEPADSTTLALAVRYILQVLERRAPGNTVEVRVPPFAVVQCIEGPRHTRGTPPNVVEMDSMVLIQLAVGEMTWEDGVAQGAIRASGIRSGIGGLFPLEDY